MNLAQGKKMRVLTQEELKEFLHYNPETGIFTWIKSTNLSIKIGKVAGSLTSFGHITTKLNKISYLLHRLAWLYMTGQMPEDCIDHINGNPSDNRFCNLRKATNAQNVQNLVKPPKHNSSGYIGVHYCKRECRFIAQIMIGGKKKNLGQFCTPIEAHEAYLKAKRQYHEFCTI